MLDGKTDRLVEAVRDGDREAFRGIVARHEAAVRVVLAAMLPDADLVDDAAQEVFVTAYLKLGDYAVGTDFTSWIKAIARNVALNERRRRRHGQATVRRYRDQVEDLLQPDWDAALGDADAEVLAGLRECLEALPPRSRQLVRARYYEESSSREIATAQGQSEPWVRVSLFRLRQALADCLAKKGLVHHG